MAAVTTVRLLVGPAKRYWILPEALLCNRIDCFRAAFQSQFKEGFAKSTHLEEEDPTVFDYLIDWVFFNDRDCVKQCSDEPYKDYQIRLCKLYVLVDKLGVEKLMGWIVDRYELCVVAPGYRGDQFCEAVQINYGNIPFPSKMREGLLVKAQNPFFSQNWGANEELAKVLALHPSYNLDIIDKIHHHMSMKTKE